MAWYSMEFYLADNRKNVDLRNSSSTIESAILEVFPSATNIMICKTYFKFYTPTGPLQSDLSKLGKTIAQKNPALDSIKTYHEKGNSLFRRKK